MYIPKPIALARAELRTARRRGVGVRPVRPRCVPRRRCRATRDRIRLQDERDSPRRDEGRVRREDARGLRRPDGGLSRRGRVARGPSARARFDRPSPRFHRFRGVAPLRLRAVFGILPSFCSWWAG